MEPKFVEIEKFYNLFVEEKKREPTAPLLAFFAKRKEGIRLSPSDAAEYIKQRQRPSFNSAQNELEALKKQRQQHKQDIQDQQNDKKRSRAKTWDIEKEFKNMKQRRSIAEKMSNLTNNNSTNNRTTKPNSSSQRMGKELSHVSIKDRMRSIDKSNSQTKIKKTWDTGSEIRATGGVGNIKNRIANMNTMTTITVNRSSNKTWNVAKDMEQANSVSIRERMSSLANKTDTQKRKNSSEGSGSGDDKLKQELSNVSIAAVKDKFQGMKTSGNGNGNSNCTANKMWNVSSDMENSVSLAQRMAELKTKRSDNSQTTWNVKKDMKNTISVGERLASMKDRENGKIEHNGNWDVSKELENVQSVKDRALNIKQSQEKNGKDKNGEALSHKAEMRELLAKVSVQNTMESVKRAGEKGSTLATAAPSWNIAEDFKNAENIRNRRESLSTMVNCRSQATSNEHKAISEDLSMLTNQVSIKDKITDMKEQNDKSNSHVKKTWDVEQEFKTAKVSIKDRLKEIAQNQNNNSKTNEILNDLQMLSQLSIKDRIESMKAKANDDNSDNNNSGRRIKTWNIADDFKQFVEQKKKIQEKIDSMQEENGDSGDSNDNDNDNDNGNGSINRSSTREALTTIVRTFSVKDRIEQMKRFEEEREKKKQEEERARRQREAREVEELTNLWYLSLSANYDEDKKIEVISKQFEHLNELILSGHDESNTTDCAINSDDGDDSDDTDNSNDSDGSKRDCSDTIMKHSGNSNDKKLVTGARLVATILASKYTNKDSIEELDFTPIEKENSENISNLINNGKIIVNSCVVKRNGNYGIIRATLNVTNNNQDNETQTVEIPDGMALEPDDSGKQPMIIAKQENSRFSLNKNETRNIELIAYCGNTSKSWPSHYGSSYKITMLKWKLPEMLPVITQNEIQDIIRFENNLSDNDGDGDGNINIDSAKTKSGIIQSAIWAKFATHV